MLTQGWEPRGHTLAGGRGGGAFAGAAPVQELEKERDSFQASPSATSPNFLPSVSFLCLYLSCELTQILTQQGLRPISSSAPSPMAASWGKQDPLAAPWIHPCLPLAQGPALR